MEIGLSAFDPGPVMGVGSVIGLSTLEPWPVIRDREVAGLVEAWMGRSGRILICPAWYATE